MRFVRLALIPLVLSLPNAATARVVAADPTSIVVSQQVEVAASPAAAYAAFGQVSRWWSKDHTYSGNAANLSLDLRPGGCFCEKLGTGGIEHLHVVLAWPGKQLVMTGLLGPLLNQATSGVMEVTLKPAGRRTSVTMTYRATGLRDAEGAALARGVDMVLGEQMKRFAAFAARR